MALRQIRIVCRNETSLESKVNAARCHGDPSWRNPYDVGHEYDNAAQFFGSRNVLSWLWPTVLPLEGGNGTSFPTAPAFD